MAGSAQLEFDIAIVGGGLIGMSLAVALADSPLSIVLLEQSQVAPINNNILDLRTTGLTRSSEQVFARAGIWQAVKENATPIEKLEISEVKSFGCARIDGDEHGITPIGYMVPNHNIISVLSERIRRCRNVTVLSPASLVALQAQGAGHRLQVNHDGNFIGIVATLLVGADGANSKVRELLDIAVTRKDYNQTAIITNIHTQKPHDYTAFERFTVHGPLAVLPITEKNFCALVWTHTAESAQKYIDCNDQQFLDKLQKSFGFRLGKITAVGKRVAYPLLLVVSELVCKQNALLLGNAAQALHPVAAQGFNLGLRDVQTFVHLLEKVEYDSAQYNQVLAEYAEIRQADRDHVIRLTDGLTRIFSTQNFALAGIRSAGIRALGMLPGAQRSLLRRKLGLRYLVSSFG